MFKDGKKNGNGKFVWSDKSYYEGNWNKNKIEGYGVFVWPNKVKINYKREDILVSGKIIKCMEKEHINMMILKNSMVLLKMIKKMEKDNINSEKIK